MSDKSYISPSSVESLLLSSPPRKDFLIIDVRSSDFPGGNLPSAINIQTHSFSTPQKTESVIKQHISSEKKLVIVHCMRSQTRGPYVAELLSTSPALPKDTEVKILRGGFQGWWRAYRGRKELFENLEDGEDEGWEDVVNAEEGSKGEAEDSRNLREGK